MKCPRWIAVCVLFSAASLALAENPSSSAAPATTQYEINVPPTSGWTDTHVDLHANDVLQITAVDATGGCNAQGLQPSGAADLTMSDFPPGTLIGKLAANTAPFLVGSGRQTTVLEPGHLFLAMNRSDKPPCEGSLRVKVQVTPSYGTVVKSKLNAALQTWMAGQFGTGAPQSVNSTASSSVAVSSGTTTKSAAASPTPPLHVSDAALDSHLAKDLDHVPRRVSDEFNNLGDMVNFVIVGSQDQLQSTLTAANWLAADESKEAAIVSAVLQTYEKKDYVQMPMSTLYLFKRPQDFGYEQAEAYSVVASRHHFRIWRAPFTWNGQTVWIGAGTHDIGFEKDQRNGKVTHKIDPAVDGERDHIGETLQKTGKVKTIQYYLPPQPVLDAKNATGGSYHSDGRLLVVFLK